MATGYVLTCSGDWTFSGGSAVCSGTLKSVPANELSSFGLSAEDWHDYTWDVLGLFAVVFGVLALKKALT